MFIDSGLDSNMSNVQTRLLGGKHYELPPGECSAELLEQAKRNLRDHCTVVGLTEEFDATLLLLRKAFGWNNLYYSRENQTRKRPLRNSISLQTQEAIRQANQYDLELYQFAQSLFRAQLDRRGVLFADELRRFRFFNQLFYPFLFTYWTGRRSIILTVRRWYPNFLSH